MTIDVMPELISFKVCPFVQRSAIILKEKNIKFKTTYVDLKNLPDWFGDISPLGKVPVLRVNNTVIFESAVIAEYLDECYAPLLHPKDLLKKAKHRSWIEFSSDITMNMFKMLYAQTEDDFNELKYKLIEQFSQVEKIIDIKGPYFEGSKFSLVDAAYAPVFLRLKLVNDVFELGIIQKAGRISEWSDALLTRQSVIESVVDNFAEVFMSYIENSNAYLSQQIFN